MNKLLLFCITVLTIVTSQVKAQNYYWIAFTDKNNTSYSLSNPEEYLSERSIQRRIKQNIPIDSLDLPVNQHYIDSILSYGFEFIHASKWLNGITVTSDLDSIPEDVMKISFIDSIQLTRPSVQNKSAIQKFIETESNGRADIDSSYYGPSVYQTGLLNGQFLHNQNFRGQGMQIAVIDGGFLNADIYPAFDSLWANNQVLGIKDFADPDSDFFQTDYHGMSVLSCIGGNVPGELIGTANKASFWLLRSEIGNVEYIVEEDNWVVAAEFADSVGVDVINSSLGYYEFDDPSTNHTYADMDGRTTRVTKAANCAAQKGMLVFSAAGNEQSNNWKYIIAPSDGDDVIGVGATNKFGFASFFTSYGPASDGDIKPNVSALGWKTYLQKSDGTYGYSNGTSFSSPVMAGMATCLWEANPHATAMEIKEALEKSSNLYESPDSLLGYGIPNMEVADFILGSSMVVEKDNQSDWELYPNPVRSYLMLRKSTVPFEEEIVVEIISVDGKLHRKWQMKTASEIVLKDLQSLPLGVLILRIRSDQSIESHKILKAH